MPFERENDGSLRPPQSYPENALATFNTHDMPTLQSWTDHNDLYVRRAIGIDSGETSTERAQSIQTLRNSLAEIAQGDQRLDISAIAKFLGATPSRLVMVALEDVVGASYQINIPGTVEQHPNWRYRLPVSIEEVDARGSLGRLAHTFKEAGRANAK